MLCSRMGVSVAHGALKTESEVEVVPAHDIFLGKIWEGRESIWPHQIVPSYRSFE